MKKIEIVRNIYITHYIRLVRFDDHHLSSPHSIVEYERHSTKYNLIRGSFSRPFRARIFRFALSFSPPFLPSVGGGFRSFRQKVAFLLGRAILIAVLRLKKILPRFCDNIAYSSYFVDFARTLVC